MVDADSIRTGALRFAGGRRQASHWARLASNVEPRRLTELLQSDWSNSLPEPQALFSVVGGVKSADDFIEMPAHKALEFSRGFARVAHATSGMAKVGSAVTPLACSGAPLLRSVSGQCSCSSCIIVCLCLCLCLSKFGAFAQMFGQLPQNFAHFRAF